MLSEEQGAQREELSVSLQLAGDFDKEWGEFLKDVRGERVYLHAAATIPF